MLDELYKDIGAKIKTWAKWIFVFESICAIIGGIGLMTDDAAFIGFCVMVCGPLAAWISSWILYAFGQLVEDVHALRNGEGSEEKITVCEEEETEEIAAEEEVEEAAAEEEVEEAAAEEEEETPESTQPSGQQCQLCGKYFDHLSYCKIQDDFGTRYRNICDNCKKSFNATEQ